MFPIIKHINDVLPHVRDNPNFVVRNKGEYTYIDYTLNTPETFHNPYERECRGIIFDKEGKLISRPYHKFFNVNEREETRNVDLSRPHVILEKLDGSMVRPFKIGDRIIWGTKAGETHITPQVEAFVAKDRDISDFAERAIDGGWTPIFEWCSRQNRVVIDYPRPFLVLTAIRINETGEYIPYQDMCDLARIFYLSVVGAYEGTVANMEALVAHTRDLRGEEGYVVRFDDGSMVKIKADEYCVMHRAKESFEREKGVVYMIAKNIIDDFKPMLPVLDLQRVEAFEIAFNNGIEMTVNRMVEDIEWAIRDGVSRKTFALDSNLSREEKSIIFTHFNCLSDIRHHFTVKSLLLQLILGNCNSQTKIDRIRHLWNNVNWNDNHSVNDEA